MSTPERERPADIDCPYCLLRREIVTIKFSLSRSPDGLVRLAARLLPMTTDRMARFAGLPIPFVGNGMR